MPNQPPLTFLMPVDSYRAAKLPAACRDSSSAEFRNAVAEAIQKDFQPFGGNLKILINQQNIQVVWLPAANSKPLELAAHLIKDHGCDVAVPF